MTTTTKRDLNQANRPARPASRLLKRGVGEGEQRFARGRSNPVAGAVRGKASPIRAWRAGETDLGPSPEPKDRAPARVARQPFGREAEAGARPKAVERAARIRAIEQAWKEERARQAALEAKEPRGF